MKLVLGIETSGTDTGVALLAGEQVLAEISCPSVSGHNENLLRLVRQALGAHTVAGLAVIGVTIGPGMFTALRVGLAVAKGLALAAGAGLKGIGTLDALAAAVGGSGEVLTLVDARRREVYAALFRGGAAVLGPALVAIDGLADWLAPTLLPADGLQLAGSGARLCSEALRRQGIVVRESGVTSPPARTVARLALRRVAESGNDDLDGLEPFYLRRTDAELKRTAP